MGASRHPKVSLRELALFTCLILPVACTAFSAGADGTGPPATATEPPANTPTPAVSPAMPQLFLDPASIWVGVDGISDSLAVVSPDGTAQTVRLPLNTGQSASNIVAARDGRFIAYLVWDADNRQHGVASWNLSEPNARLVIRPQQGYRMIAVHLADDSSGLAVVQIAEGQPVEEADWHMDYVPPTGGEPVLLASRESLGDVVPLIPFAWPAGGPLLLNAVIPTSQQSEGIYAVSPDTGAGRLVIPLEEQIVVAPALSADGTHLAYLTYDPQAPQAPTGDLHPVNVVRVHDLRLDRTTTIAAPEEGQSIVSMRWMPDSKHLLLELIKVMPEDGQIEQLWAVAGLDQPLPWPQSGPGPGRDVLFDYQPFGEGVVYTVLPVDDTWALYILDDLDSDQPPRVIPLDGIAQEAGMPYIVRVP